MTFPKSERVIYRKNPLAEVICQLRFPTILRIETSPPADFQDRIRKNYPEYRDPTSTHQSLSLKLPIQVLPPPPHQFISEEGTWTVSLSKDFLAVSTTQYRRWEEFKMRLQESLRALCDIYNPSSFSRVGLRYCDTISRDAFSLEGVEWSKLLREHIAGELSSPEISSSVLEIQKVALVKLSQFDARVRIRHGLAKRIESNVFKEDIYLIDSDFYSEKKLEVKNVDTALDYFNEQSGRLFRWCIKDSLHTAMEPEPLE